MSPTNSAETSLSSTEAHHLDVARHFMLEGIAKADLSAFDAALNPDISVRTGLSPMAPIQGRDAYKEVFSGFAAAFPVRDFVLHEIFAAGDKVVARFTATAAFEKDYYGVQATRQILAMEEVHLLTFKEGKIISNIVSATNFPFEYIMYPVLKAAVLDSLEIAE